MNKSDVTRDFYMLKGALAKKGYDWWWHSFTGHNDMTGEEKAFYVEYFLCNPALAQKDPVIVWNDPVAKKSGKKPSYCMVNVGFWGNPKGQLHRFFPWSDVSVEQNAPLNLVAGDCICSETHIKGSVTVSARDAGDNPQWMCDCGSMEWDLKVSKKIAYNVGYGASKFFRLINAFEMFWHAEGMKTVYEGYVILNGQRYTINPDDCFGYADKNWGSDFTSPWVWLSSSDLVSNITGKPMRNSVFEVGGGRPKIFGIALNRKLLGQFYYEGTDYEFNFSKFWTGSRTIFSSEETEDQIKWHVTMTTFHAKMEAEICCNKDEMILINYEAPNGTKRHNRLWNGGTGYGTVKLYERKRRKWVLLDSFRTGHVGCEYGEYTAV